MKSKWLRAALSTCIMLVSWAAFSAETRPNILVLIADDWSWPNASIAGEPELKTPNFDRIAREGLLFNHAYASAPSCTASRGALLTGQYHWRLEQGMNLHSFLPSKFQVYPDLLEKQGYHVGLTRKGWAPGRENMGGRTRNPAGPRFADFNAFRAKRNTGQPFCFWFGSIDPHRPYDRNAGTGAGKDPAKVRLPGEYPDADLPRRDMLDYFYEIERFDREIGEIIAQIEQDGELDNTIVVITGDNGRPFPRGKATLYDAGTNVPLAIRWPKGIKHPGRVIDDFVSLTDLAPTFLDAVGIKGLPDATGRSLRPVFESEKTGWVDPARSFVLTGMERHTACRDIGPDLPGGGYPMRAIRTKEFHLIHNFTPNRWPMGDWRMLADDSPAKPTEEQLTSNTFAAFGDCDASPTKAWMLLNRDDPKIKTFFELAFGKRPEFELYDIAHDPAELKNLASDPAHADILEKLKSQLDHELHKTRDPRVLGQIDVIERYEYLGNASENPRNRPAAQAKKAQAKTRKANQ